MTRARLRLGLGHSFLRCRVRLTSPGKVGQMGGHRLTRKADKSAEAFPARATASAAFGKQLPVGEAFRVLQRRKAG